MAGVGGRRGCHRQDYRHLRSRLWVGSVQTLAAAIYSRLRPRSEGIEKIESTRRWTGSGGAQAEGLLVAAWFLAARGDRNSSAWYCADRITCIAHRPRNTPSPGL